MVTMNIAIYLLAVAGLAVGLTVGPVQAEDARVNANVGMLASPVASSAIVNVVPHGALVNARYCLGNGWCRVTWRGQRGWINRHHLRMKLLKRKV